MPRRKKISEEEKTPQTTDSRDLQVLLEGRRPGMCRQQRLSSHPQGCELIAQQGEDQGRYTRLNKAIDGTQTGLRNLIGVSLDAEPLELNPNTDHTYLLFQIGPEASLIP